MALVDYTTSDEDEEEKNTGTSPGSSEPSAGPKDLKRKRRPYPVDDSDLPPLPSKFHDLYASKVRLSTLDNPSLHGGRKRITPHVEGNWPSHVYIEWYPSTAEYELLTSLITPIQNAAARAGGVEIVSLLASDLGTPLPLHVSLSRSISLTAAQKDAFVESLHENIVGCGVRPFELKLENFSWASNFEKIRWFLALQLQRPEGNGLNRILAVCNGTAGDYSQPPLYASPKSAPQQSPKANGRSSRYKQSNISDSPRNGETLDFSSAFHFSIGWALEKPSSLVVNITEATINDEMLRSLKRISIKVDTVKVKVGNVVTSICLAQNTAEVKGVFGA